MTLREITIDLNSALEARGFRSAIVSAAHVPKLRKIIETGLTTGRIHHTVYKEYSEYFDKMFSDDFPSARSIIVVAAPQPMLEVLFTIEGKQRSVIIPPTYEHSVDETVTNTIEGVLAPNGYKIDRAILPQKLLAAHSGLACYGKNNIAFVDGLGSFHRPLAFYTDLPCEHDTWQEPQMLEECDRCTACVKKCPTGAIDPDQFQLRAERCLTYYNESSEPFPSWLDKSWHHCVIGCMRCQSYCPVNKDVRSWTEPFAELTGEESQLLLDGVSKDELPTTLLAKFMNTDLLDDPAVLSRNLKSVLAATD